MATVQIINDDRHFKGELANAGKKLVIVDFTASGCESCQRIAPIFEQLSLKYPNAVFLKVDVDKCADTASMQDVSATPTFVFYRKRTRLGHCTDPMGLESKIQLIQQFYGSGDADDANNLVANSLPKHLSGRNTVRNTEKGYYHIFGMILLVAVLFFLE